MTELPSDYVAAQRWLDDLRRAREKGDMTRLADLIHLDYIVNALRSLERLQLKSQEFDRAVVSWKNNEDIDEEIIERLQLEVDTLTDHNENLRLRLADLSTRYHRIRGTGG